MIDVNDFVYALKRRLPYFDENAVSKIKNITNIVISGSDVLLTIPNHGIANNENYASVYGIKYKYNLTRILKLPSQNNKKRFAVELNKLNPIVINDYDVKIGGVVTDINYNGTFKIVKKQGINPNANGLFTSFILETDANVTTQEILNQGYILYEVIDSPLTKNALNGYKNISIVDQNTIKFTINSSENKYQWQINNIDFSSGKIGRVDAYFIFSEGEIDTILTQSKGDKYLIFINETRQSSSINGISNTSATSINNISNNMQIMSDIFFNVYVLSRQSSNIDNGIHSLKDKQQINKEYNNLRNAILQIICTTNPTINKPFNTKDNSFSRPIKIGDNFDSYYGQGSRFRWVNEFKSTILINPGVLSDENISSPLNTMYIGDDNSDGEVNYLA